MGLPCDRRHRGSGWQRRANGVHLQPRPRAKLERRKREIERIAEFFAKRQADESKGLGKLAEPPASYILLGDFNVVSPDHETMKALTSNGFEVPAAIGGDKFPTRDHFYDQIAVRAKDPRFKTDQGGIVQMYEDIFRAGDLAEYASHIPKKDPEKDERYQAKSPNALYEKWRTWQLSDHKPLWIEISTDYSGDYLAQFA